MNKDRQHPLPWQALAATEGDIPWEAIFAFSDALEADPGLWRQLAKRYDAVTLFRTDYRGFEDLYIPAIFAQAAPQLDQETRLEISPFLLEKLSEAGYEDSDIRLEVLSAACGSLGPVILPQVMEFIDCEEDTDGAWVFLWSLLRLAEQADEQVRRQVIDFCVEVLRLAHDDQVSVFDVMFIPEILVQLNCREHLGLLKQLAKKAKGSHAYAEFNESIQVLTGKKPPFQYEEMWQVPVDDWLPFRWKRAKKWYAENSSPLSPEDEQELERFRLDKIQRRFLRSEAGSSAIKAYRDDVPFITDALLNYLWDYEGVYLEQISEQALYKVLIDLFPRKVVAAKEELEHVGPVVAVFLNWLENQAIVPHGAALADRVKGWSNEIVARGMNPEYWSMGKGFSMRAQADGVDTTDIDAMRQYMHVCNIQRLAQISDDGDDSLDRHNQRAPIPIAGTESKTGRNEPCPCGSGKKFKKCCGPVNQRNR